MNFSFLTSVRFWAIVGIAVVTGLVQAGILDKALGDTIVTILAGYAVIRTVDRNFGDAAK
jgi:hypothetical protein